MFYGCSNIEYINLDISNIKSNLSTEDIFSLTPDNLIICIENENYKFIDIFPESKVYQCYNSHHENKYICYMKDSSLYNKHICNICQKKLLIDYSALNYNNTNVSCYESETDISDNYQYFNFETNTFLKIDEENEAMFYNCSS